MLCEALRIECPQIYIETNSASAIYEMTHTPEQEYGIYHFLDAAINDSELKDSCYYELERKAINKGCYLGSPGLALNILGNEVQKYVFYDKDNGALENIAQYAQSHNITKYDTYNCDSIEEVLNILPSLPLSTFLHIDPYEIDKQNSNGHTYLDILIKATQLGLKCLLWYGYMNFEDKLKINSYLVESLYQAEIKNYICVELIMNLIEQKTIPDNPGVLGSGILATNLSPQVHEVILNYSKRLTDIYKNVSYKENDGSVYLDTIGCNLLVK
ncbi:MAG: hypothetical protein RR370_03750, partial [Synergistaceae bacterium]